jgi:hypothetical protein
VRLLLVRGSKIVGIADSPEYSENFEQFEKVVHAIPYNGDTMSEDERQNAVQRRLQAQRRFVAERKAPLIQTIKSLMDEGYTPIGVIAPDSEYTFSRSTAGWLPEDDANCLMDFFEEGFKNGRNFEQCKNQGEEYSWLQHPNGYSGVAA